MFYALQQDGEPDVSDLTLALLTTSADVFRPGKVKAVVEGNIVISECSTLPEAYMFLLGLMYVFNIEYPKKLVNTFKFIQTFVVCLDDNTPLKPCLLSLKNELFEVHYESQGYLVNIPFFILNTEHYFMFVPGSDCQEIIIFNCIVYLLFFFPTQF